MTDSGAVLAFTDPEPARRLAGLGPGGSAPLLTADVRELPERTRPATGFVPRPDDTALLAYTSGTTGRPKGVPLTHRQVAVSIRAAMAAWRWHSDDVLVHALPLFHQHGLGGLHAALIAGGTVHIRSKFSAADLVQAVGDARASVLFAVPTIYQALAESAPGRVAGPMAGLRDLRLAVCGSAPLSPALAAGCPLSSGGCRSSGTARPRAGWTSPTRSPIPTGTRSGCRCPACWPGYGPRMVWRIPARTARSSSAGRRSSPATGTTRRPPQAAFTLDGWFRTGDIGAVDPAAGHLVIRGRTKEMIITGGLNVYPREVEIALESHPSVAEAAVAGVADERWGERVTAWVVLADGHGFDEAALIAHARTLLAGYKCPKRVFRLAALPRNQLGKILRSALR